MISVLPPHLFETYQTLSRASRINVKCIAHLQSSLLTWKTALFTFVTIEVCSHPIPFHTTLTCYKSQLKAKMSQDDERRRYACVSGLSRLQPCSYRVSPIVSIGKFIDPKEEAITKREWSTTAPDWRKAARGVNLEGKSLH
jgi:hypothetical protein